MQFVSVLGQRQKADDAPVPTLAMYVQKYVTLEQTVIEKGLF